MAPHSTALDAGQINATKKLEKAPTMMIVDDLIAARALERDQPPLLSFPKGEQGVADYEHFNAADLDRFVDQAAKYYIRKGFEPNNHEKNKTVAHVGPTDFAYIITFFALGRLGYAPLCLSPRLAPHACAKLIDECRAVALIPGNTPQMSKLVAKTQKLRPINVIESVSRAEFDKAEAKGERFFRKDVDRETERHWTACILHSSGSTGLPRPIHIPHRRLMMQLPPAPRQREFTTFPMFHGYGNWIIIHNIVDRKWTYMYNSNLPVTADSVIKAVENLRPDVLHVVPFTLELLALSKEGVSAMKSCKRVIFSGSGCPDELGNRLTEEGVTIESSWGATEMGMLGASYNRAHGDDAWNYIRIPKPINDHVWFKPLEDDVYECVFLKGLPSLVASNSDDPAGSFWSRDLFIKHPTLTNAWKHIGRLDDRLTLTNGEKVLPLPMEGQIRQDPLIRESVIFGTGKSIPGLLAFRNDESAKMSDNEFIENIWPTIQSANAHAESFSQISKETVVPISAEIEYPETDKGTIKRARIYDEFSKEICSMYERLQYAGTGTLQFDIPQLENWFLDTFKNQLGVPLWSVDSDFFDAGVTSLQAIQMRGLILKNMDLGGNNRRLGQNIVFDTGNVSRLARDIRAIRLGQEMIDDDKDALQEMVSLITKYSKLTRHTPGVKQPEGQVLLLTGVTGSLGAQLLAHLLNTASIKHVYCLIRGPEPRNRVLSALHQRHLNVSSSSKLTALTADLSQSFLGLSQEDYLAVQSSITHIIHSAWAVNFNLGIRSFESQHIAGVHHLLQLSLSSPHPFPANFYFCSSIATALATPGPATIAEGPINNLSHALPQGYARSKLVAEHIVRNAVYDFGARARTFRIGQIVGDKKTGLWNGTEAVPLIIRSALTLKALPALDENESWLPVDTLATTICELAGLVEAHKEGLKTSAKDRDLVYNLENLSTFHWTKDLLPELAQLGMQFESVPPAVWLEKLRAYQGDAEANPAVKLIEHFESMCAKAGSAGGGGPASRVRFDLGRAENDSESLRTAPKLVQDGYVKKFVEAWMEEWEGKGREVEVESSG